MCCIWPYRDRASISYLNSSRRLSETTETAEDYRRHLERVLRDADEDDGQAEAEGLLNTSRIHSKHKGTPAKLKKMKPPSKERSSLRKQNNKVNLQSETNGSATKGNMSPMENAVSHKDSVDLSSPPNGVATDSDSGVSLSGVPKSPNESAWFTKPLHLESASKDYVHSFSDFTTVPVSSRPAGQLGAQLAAKHIANTDVVKAKDMHSYPVASMDELVKEYFPFTLGASFSVRAADSPTQLDLQTKAAGSISPTISTPGKGLVKQSIPWKPKRSKSPRRTRPGSAQSTNSSTSRGSGRSSKSLDRLFLLTTEAPIAGRKFIFCCG